MRPAGFGQPLAGIVFAGAEEERAAHNLSVFDTCLGGLSGRSRLMNQWQNGPFGWGGWGLIECYLVRSPAMNLKIALGCCRVKPAYFRREVKNISSCS